jgi:hypothetical protein
MLTKPAEGYGQELNNMANNNANLDVGTKSTLSTIADFLGRLASEFMTVI